MKTSTLRNIIKEEISSLIKEAGGIIDKTRAKKIARQARELIARLESLPEYQEVKAKYDEGEISKTAFQTIIRKELVTPQEIDFMHKLAHYSQVSKSSFNYAYDQKEYPWSMVSQSNIARELYDVGLAYNQYAKTGPHALATSPARVYRPGFAKMKRDFTF